MKEFCGTKTKTPFSQKSTEYLLKVVSGRIVAIPSGDDGLREYAGRRWAAEILKMRGVL